jgi:hypothetical protein
VLLYNSLDSIQAEARAFPNSFGGEERLKDVGFHLTGYSWTVIANIDYHATVVAIGPDAKLAFSAHRINRVIDNVGPHLI